MEGGGGRGERREPLGDHLFRANVRLVSLWGTSPLVHTAIPWSITALYSVKRSTVVANLSQVDGGDQSKCRPGRSTETCRTGSPLFLSVSSAIIPLNRLSPTDCTFPDCLLSFPWKLSAALLLKLTNFPVNYIPVVFHSVCLSLSPSSLSRPRVLTNLYFNLYAFTIALPVHVCKWAKSPLPALLMFCLSLWLICE